MILYSKNSLLYKHLKIYIFSWKMSIFWNFWPSFGGVSARARAKYFTRFLGMYWSIQIWFFMSLRPKATTLFFSHLLFLSQQKMLSKYCPTIKEHFLFKNFSQKVFLMSLNTKKWPLSQGGGGNSETTYVFASYVYWNKLLKT